MNKLCAINEFSFTEKKKIIFTAMAVGKFQILNDSKLHSVRTNLMNDKWKGKVNEL